jgi:hypothetical protein
MNDTIRARVFGRFAITQDNRPVHGLFHSRPAKPAPVGFGEYSRFETRDCQRILGVACHEQTQNDEKNENVFEIQNHVYRIISSG